MSGAQEAVLAPLPAQRSAARAGLWRRFARSGPATAGAVVLLLVVACVLPAPVLPLSDPDAREIIYGMPYKEWQARHQVEATAEQKAAFAQANPAH